MRTKKEKYPQVVDKKLVLSIVHLRPLTTKLINYLSEYLSINKLIAWPLPAIMGKNIDLRKNKKN